MPCAAFTAWLISAAVLLALLWAAPWGKASSDPGNEEDDYRTWTDATGEFHVEAALVGFAEGKRATEKRDGSMISVPAAKLSKSDRSYLQRELARRRQRRNSRLNRRRMTRRRAKSRLKSAEKPEAVESFPITGGSAQGGRDARAADWPGWARARARRQVGGYGAAGKLAARRASAPLAWHRHRQGIFPRWRSSAAASTSTGVIGERLVISVFDSEGNASPRPRTTSHGRKLSRRACSTPTIDEGNLYLISRHGLVGCYSAESLQKKWSVHMRDFGGSPPEWGYAESVLILGPLAIITPGGSKCIVALNKANGQPVWVSGGLKAAAQYGSCFAFEFEGVPIVVAGTHGGLAGVDARNGQALFFNPFAAGNTASCPTPIAEAGHVFRAAGYGKGGICMKLVNSRGRLTAEQA